MMPGRPPLVWSVHVADLETPVSAFLKLSQGATGNIFLLESVEGGATRGRYSMIGLDPDAIWRCTGALSEINRTRCATRDSVRALPGNAARGAARLPGRIGHRHAAGAAADVGRRLRLPRL